MQYTFRPKGVCSNQIIIDLDGDIIRQVSFAGGCDGNLKGISRLVAGMTVAELEEKFAGICCGRKSTSCPDQLAIAVRLAYQNEQARVSGNVRVG